MDEDKVVEQKLIKSLLEFIHHTREYQASVFARGETFAHSIAKEFLANLRQVCMNIYLYVCMCLSIHQ